MNFHLNVLANFIVNTYFTSSNCLFILNNNLAQFEYVGNIPNVILTTNDEIDEDIIFKYHGCQGIVILSETPRKIFEDFEDLIRLMMERFNYRRYLILPMNNSNSLEIFNSDRLDFVADFLLVNNLSEDDRIFGLYTHRYIGRGNSQKDIVEIDRWFLNNQTFLRNENLYPNKLMDQNGRDLRIATFTYKPYAIPENNDGTEVFIALEFAKRYNMTPKFVVDEIGEWGEIYDNWTGDGILGNIVMDRGDMGLGALYTWEHEYHFLDIAKPSLRTGITSITPAPKLLGGWFTLFLSFSQKMWVMTFVSFFLAFLAIFFAVTFESKTQKNSVERNNAENWMKSFMLTQAIFLLQGLSKIPKNSHSRIIFALTLLLSLMMASLFSCGLASNMTVPRYSGTIHNVRDLAKSDLKWGATSLAWVSALFNDDSIVYKKVVNNFLPLSYEELLKKNNENFGYAVERLNGGNYAIGNYITKEGAQQRRLMDEDIDWEYSVIMLKKSSILLPNLDRLLLEIAQSGLMYVWEYEVTVRTSDMKIQKAVHLSAHKTRPENIKLSLTHVEGAFALWTLGIVVSTIVFIGEICHRKR